MISYRIMILVVIVIGGLLTSCKQQNSENQEMTAMYFRSFDFENLHGLDPLSTGDYPFILVKKSDTCLSIQFVLNDTISKNYKAYKKTMDTLYYSKKVYDNMGFREIFEYRFARNLFEEKQIVYPHILDTLNKIVTIYRYTNGNEYSNTCYSYKKGKLVSKDYFKGCQEIFDFSDNKIVGDSLFVIKNNEIIGRARKGGKFRLWNALFFGATDLENIKYIYSD